MPLRARTRLGKYRIVRHIASGGFGSVYEARDTIENIRVALKVLPKDAKASDRDLMRREIRLMVRLDHPNILPIKNADEINSRLVVATPLGVESLHERMRRRMGAKTALDMFEQMLQALAYAHDRRIVHRDVKPDNVILFPGNVAKLGDFGLAKHAQRTLWGTGAGTLGYMAPEQAMGRPSLRSDVFCVGLVLYRMLAGELPDWPFTWPLPGNAKLRTKVSPRLVTFLRRALEVDQRKRYANAGAMLRAYEGIHSKLKSSRRNGRKATRRRR